MPSNYIGNPIAVESPSAAPGPGIPPTLSLPSDGDPDAGATFAQPFKVLADEIAYVKTGKTSKWNELLWPSGSFTSSQTPIPNFGALQVQINGAGSSVTFNDPGAIAAAYNGRCATLTAGATNSFYAALDSYQKFAGFANPANLVIIAEFDVALSAAAIANNCANGFGFNTNNLIVSNGGTIDGMIVQFDSNINANWQFIVGRSGVGNVVTTLGVAPTAAVFQHFRIRFFGASTPQGVANASAYATVSVNDGAATSVNLSGTQFPSLNSYFGGCSFANSANAVTSYMGTWTVQWNHY